MAQSGITSGPRLWVINCSSPLVVRTVIPKFLRRVRTILLWWSSFPHQTNFLNDRMEPFPFYYWGTISFLTTRVPSPFLDWHVSFLLPWWGKKTSFQRSCSTHTIIKTDHLGSVVMEVIPRYLAQGTRPLLFRTIIIIILQQWLKNTKMNQRTSHYLHLLHNALRFSMDKVRLLPYLGLPNIVRFRARMPKSSKLTKSPSLG